MRELLLTLGHNSSAILIEEGQIVNGWESERLTGVKSDSRMPPIYNLPTPDRAYITHWSPDGSLKNVAHKYWQPELLDGVPIRTLSTEVSHHDTHMAAAMCYASTHFPMGATTIGVVIDGFGTAGEHFSIYRLWADKPPTLLRRYRGYDTSLGLLYQYATAFMGMKMHEDEYKLLGYEVHVTSDMYKKMTTEALDRSHRWVEAMDASVYISPFDPMYNINALGAVKESVFAMLQEVCKIADITDPTSPEGRAALACFVQALLEFVVFQILSTYSYKNLIVSGGVFYNVKLNHKLLSHVASYGGQFCVYPLAGDQGNALGLYAMDHPEFNFPDSLSWGVRDLHSVGHVSNLYVMDEKSAQGVILGQLETIGCVNVVRGNMEFGPRALCNTSTLALPKMDVVAKINAANNRNTVMPMAPVMTKSMYEKFFELTDNVWFSECHMILAMTYKKDVLHENLMGIAHRYNYPYEYATGRPQVTYDNWLAEILDYFGSPLINTSYNFHGQPIAYDMESIIKNHLMQQERDSSIKTIVIQNVN